MCYDDFDFDGYDDGMGDPDDDFQEDMFEEEIEPEMDEFELQEEPDGPAVPESVALPLSYAGNICRIRLYNR